MTARAGFQFAAGDLIQAVVDCRSVSGDRIEAGRMYTVAALDRGGWPILSTDRHGGGGWAPGQFRRASPVETVPVPAGVLAELRAAVADWEQAPASQQGECKDGIVAVAVALLDEIPQEA